MYQTAEPVYRWHKEHEEFLVNRQPIASVGVVWSQQNTDFYGRDDADLLVDLPWRGITQALIRARIPYLPVHADHIDRDAAQFSLLVLPNLGAMSDAQVASVRRFVERGGGLMATGESQPVRRMGRPAPGFRPGRLVRRPCDRPARAGDEARRKKHASDTAHTYLRLNPELPRPRGRPADRRRTGHHRRAPPGAARLRGNRHPALRRRAGAPPGGCAGAEVLVTFVPAFPIYPPETAWMREPKTNIPGLILNTTPAGARVAFLPADLDRRFARDNLPDHGDLLANLIRWAAKDDIPLAVEGPGLIDCHLYRQPGRLILHLVNLTSAGTWRQPVHELIPVGPLKLRVQRPADVRGKRVRLLVAGKTRYRQDLRQLEPLASSVRPRPRSRRAWVRPRIPGRNLKRPAGLGAK